MTNLVPTNRSATQPVTGIVRPPAAPNRSLPLGSAAWLGSEGSAVGPVRSGDFFLGMLENGTRIGFRDDRHVLVVAGTRSGKGVSVIIPNLILWPGSVVVIDPKGENAKVAARRRSTGNKFCHGRRQKTCILDPFDEVPTSRDSFSELLGGYNPLDLISPQREESIDTAARIAQTLIVSENTADPIWDNSAKDALKGVILHVASSPNFRPDERNLVTVQRLLRSGDQRARQIAELASPDGKAPTGMLALFEAMQRNRSFNGIVSGIGTQLAELSESPRTLAGVLQVVRVNLSFIDSPGMQRCLSRSTFKLSDLKTSPGGLSLYLCLPQRFFDTHFRWLRMMTELIIGEMEQIKDWPVNGYPVLMMLDEFPALKRMRVVENAAAQIAGFGVKLMFVVQDFGQLKALYQDSWETFISNSGLKLFFCVDDNFTRKYVSEWIGETEVIRTARSTSRTDGSSWSTSTSVTLGHSQSSTLSHGPGGFSSSSTVGYSGSTTTGKTYGGSSSLTEGMNESIHKRPLLTPDEVGRYFGNRDNPTALALISGYYPLYLLRPPYFRDIYWGGFYDVHPNHPLPPTIEQADAARAEAANRAKLARAKAEADLRWEQEQEANRKAFRQKERERYEQMQKERLIRYHEIQARDEMFRSIRRWCVRIVLWPLTALVSTFLFWSIFISNR